MEDLSTVVQQGGLGELVRYRSLRDDSICLRFDAGRLRRFYRTELDSFPSYRLVANQSGRRATDAKADASVTAVSLYPNPATSRATLTFGTAAIRTVQLYSSQGRLVQTLSASGSSKELAVQELPAGTYLVRISSPSADVQTRRLLVEH
nr:T9SS type A sorting domain-containing protein [Hymenobacter translucens]